MLLRHLSILASYVNPTTVFWICLFKGSIVQINIIKINYILFKNYLYKHKYIEQAALATQATQKTKHHFVRGGLLHKPCGIFSFCVRMVLTERQKKDLHEAMLEYLLSEGTLFSKTIDAFREEAQLTTLADSGKGLLEKKWTSVVRLQKKIMELESQIGALQQQVKSGGSTTAALDMTNPGDARIIPRAPARSTLSGHRAPVTVVTVHPVYSLMASGSEDSTIKIWDYETAQYERTLKGHTGPVTGVAFDSTGNVLASCSADMSAKLWDMSTYLCTKTLRGHDHTISSIRFVPSGDQVLTCSRDHTIKCWEIATGFCIRTYSGHSDWVKCISVSLDGELLASGGSDQSITIWRISNGQTIQVSCFFVAR